MLYLSLNDKSEPYSTIPSLFKEMTRIFYCSFFRKYNNLMKYNPSNSSGSSSSLLLYMNQRPNEKFENILFAWKSADDINVLFSKRENNIENEENSFSIMDLDDVDPDESDVTLPLEDETNFLEDHIDGFSNLCGKMHSLDLIKRTNDVLEELLCEEIELKVRNTCKRTFGKPMLRRSTRWLYSTVYPWLQIILSSNSQLSRESVEGNLQRYF